MIDRKKNPIENERGIAMMVTLLVVVAVAALSTGAAMLKVNASLVNRYTNRLSVLESVADAGLEVARSRINGGAVTYPDTGYITIESNATVSEAGGSIIPNVSRSTYIGPTGITSGQYGVFGSVVTVAEDTYGNRVVRRREIEQESFAKYAYFTNIEGNIVFAGGDQIWGPVHSNDRIRIYYSGATFHGDVVTARYVQDPQYGTFDLGYTENGPNIPMPATADLNKLQTQASAGNMAIVGTTSGYSGTATTRIEFVAIDLNGDGLNTGANEGFIRVYQSSDYRWVTGEEPSDYSSKGLRNSDNCGHYHGSNFVEADAHSGSGSDNWKTALASSSRRCYLGGSDSLWGSFQPNDSRGGWVKFGGTVSPTLAGRPDREYLWPLSRALNPTSKGVIFVQGHVVISGVLRGRVTLAATGDIIIGDDITYATDPGSGLCADLLGIFAGDDVIIADNPINAPFRRKRPGASNNSYYTFDDTTGEFIHGVILALDIFTVQNYNSGSSNAQYCETKRAGRGCIYLTGGIIQRQRGAVGLTSGQGYSKRYAYDQCVLTEPPPYFPTTGHFVAGRYFEVDPTNFDVANLFGMLTP